ncbi:hypothetical protein AAG906_041060 [Vitis piasezkii]
MCGSDDHLAWKRPVSSEECRGLRIAGGISSMFSSCIPYLMFHALQDWFFILSVDLPSWVRVDGSLVCFSKRSDMDYIPVANLPAKFGMLDIKRYMGVGCPFIIITSQFRRSEPSPLLSFGGQSHHFSVSVFRVILIAFSVSTLRAIITSQIDVQMSHSQFWCSEPSSISSLTFRRSEPSSTFRHSEPSFLHSLVFRVIVHSLAFRAVMISLYHYLSAVWYLEPLFTVWHSDPLFTVRHTPFPNSLAFRAIVSLVWRSEPPFLHSLAFRVVVHGQTFRDIGQLGIQSHHIFSSTFRAVNLAFRAISRQHSEP